MVLQFVHSYAKRLTNGFEFVMRTTVPVMLTNFSNMFVFKFLTLIAGAKLSIRALNGEISSLNLNVANSVCKSIVVLLLLLLESKFVDDEVEFRNCDAFLDFSDLNRSINELYLFKMNFFF